MSAQPSVIVGQPIEDYFAAVWLGMADRILEFEVLEDSVLTVRSSNHIFAAQGYAGGLGPRPSRVIINPDRPDREELSAIETRHLKAGDVIRFERSGGAGFGPPAERAAEAVRDDVRNGYVSPQAAADIYGRPQDKM